MLSARPGPLNPGATSPLSRHHLTRPSRAAGSFLGPKRKLAGCYRSQFIYRAAREGADQQEKCRPSGPRPESPAQGAWYSAAEMRAIGQIDDRVADSEPARKKWMPEQFYAPRRLIKRRDYIHRA